MEDFTRHFQTLSNTPHKDFDLSEFERNARVEALHVDELDREISVAEVSETISSLRRNKSCDYENNVADFFIDDNDFISSYLVQVFNNIFTSGIYPELRVFNSNPQKGR